eukprot:sb/3478430/
MPWPLMHVPSFYHQQLLSASTSCLPHLILKLRQCAQIGSAAPDRSKRGLNMTEASEFNNIVPPLQYLTQNTKLNTERLSSNFYSTYIHTNNIRKALSTQF